MSFWIDSNGQVYAGDRQGNDKPATKPPPDSMWDKVVQDWIAIPPDPWPSIQKVFSQAISENPTVATPALQKELLKLADVVQRALELNLFDAAREAINEPVLPPELEPYRNAMLALIPTK